MYAFHQMNPHMLKRQSFNTGKLGVGLPRLDTSMLDHVYNISVYTILVCIHVGSHIAWKDGCSSSSNEVDCNRQTNKKAKSTFYSYLTDSLKTKVYKSSVTFAKHLYTNTKFMARIAQKRYTSIPHQVEIVRNEVWAETTQTVSRVRLNHIFRVKHKWK